MSEPAPTERDPDAVPPPAPVTSDSPATADSPPPAPSAAVASGATTSEATTSGATTSEAATSGAATSGAATGRPDPYTPPAPDRSRDDAVVHARGLTHRYDDEHGITDVDLDVPAGRILGVVGPSGSGKTTLARLVLGLLPAHDGTIEVLGVDPWQAGRHHHTRLGYLPQGNALDPELSLRHNLDFMASLQGLPWRARWWPGEDAKVARKRIDDVLELVGLTGEQNTRLRRASGGEQRRLAIAAAIVHDPELLILDEPTAGIDPVLRAQLWEHLTNLRDEGHTLFITTQYVTEADLCDEVALMVDGRIIRVDEPDGLRRAAYGGDLLDVEHESVDPGRIDLEDVDGVESMQERLGPRRVRYLVSDREGVQSRISDLFAENEKSAPVLSWHRPSFDDVFVELVETHRAEQASDEERGVDREREAVGA